MTSTEKLLHEALQQNQELLRQQTKFLKEIKQLNEKIAYLTDKLYGRHSEKLDDPNQQSLFEDNGVFTEPEQTGQQSEEPEVTTGENGKTRKPKRKRSEIISTDLPTEDEVHEPMIKLCPQGHDLQRVGKHYVRQEVRVIPGRLYVANIYEATYKCHQCDQQDAISHLYQGNAPWALIPHSMASASLVSEIAYHKYVLGTPLYRQKGYWKNQGLDLSDKTMGNWMIACAQIVKPVYDLLRQNLASQKFLQGDETPYQVLQEPGKLATSKSYIWLARTIGRAQHQIVLYHYADSRAGKVAQQLYSGFTGVLQCDGYYGYNAIADSVEHVGCWAHVRRKFYDDANIDKKHFNASKGLTLIGQMMHEEQKWRKWDSVARYQARQKYLKPLLDEFWQWCDMADVLPKTRLGKAIAYAQGQRTALNRVLLYGEVDFTNNASERNMKSYVIGRKNWLFSTSPQGAEANAIWMSIVESAKANKTNPREYIEFLLKNVSQLSKQEIENKLEAYLPWNYNSSSIKQVEA